MYKKEKIMIKKPLVTVIIPAYNTEKYISKCLDSILVQSYQELEIIISSTLKIFIQFHI